MKPVILITHKYTADPNDFGVGELIRIKENYCRAVIKAGGVPILSAMGDPQVYANICDGVIFTGGADIDPIRYGETPYKEDMNIVKRLDEMELCVFEEFYKLGKPMFGVCRGIQLINVAMGGTLIQDIPTMVEKPTHRESIIPGKNAHRVRTDKDSFLNGLFGDEFTVNTHHHQSVKKCGKGLKVAAVADDGVIEAIEHESLPICAVQWHPERMIGEENFEMQNMMPLFEYFVSMCGEHSERG